MSKRIVLFSAIAALLPLSLLADVPSRPANPLELAVIQKVVQAIDAAFDRFASPDWEQASALEHEEFDVATNPDRPLNVALQCGREFAIRRGSPLFNSKVKPVQDALTNTKDLDKMVALGKQIDGTMRFTVEAEPNVFTVNGNPSDLAHDLGAKGASFSFCTTDPELDCYVYFGERSRWKTRFAFAHPNGTPAIENLFIRFHAKNPKGMAAERIRELIRTTDWTPVAASLTK